MSEPAGLTCPGCGELAAYALGNSQAFCGNDDCAILIWDPGKTAEELHADMHFVDLRQAGEYRGGEEGKG